MQGRKRVGPWRAAQKTTMGVIGSRADNVATAAKGLK
jgi:hypothetical protein